MDANITNSSVTFSIRETLVSDAGLYRCVVEDVFGQQRNNSALVIVEGFSRNLTRSISQSVNQSINQSINQAVNAWVKLVGYHGISAPPPLIWDLHLRHEIPPHLVEDPLPYLAVLNYIAHMVLVSIFYFINGMPRLSCTFYTLYLCKWQK